MMANHIALNAVGARVCEKPAVEFDALRIGWNQGERRFSPFLNHDDGHPEAWIKLNGSLEEVISSPSPTASGRVLTDADTKAARLVSTLCGRRRTAASTKPNHAEFFAIAARESLADAQSSGTTLRIIRPQPAIPIVAIAAAVMNAQ
jgi:hypothetical protein